jgi:hypothetical protein
MTLETAILRDLEKGPSTADAIAQREKRSLAAVNVTLDRMLRQGTVVSSVICDGRLTVWRINTVKA